MATFIWAGNNVRTKSGEYLYEQFAVTGLSPWATVDKTMGQWSIGEYGSDGGDSLQVARWQYTKDDSSYSMSVSFSSSIVYDNADYDYVGTVISSITSSQALPQLYTQTANEYNFNVSQAGGTEWCLIPVYVARACTLTCDGNGGTPSTQAVDFRSGIPFALPDAPTREGYSFLGWSIAGEIYRAGDEFTSRVSATAVAQWSEVPPPPPPAPGKGAILYTQGGSPAFNPSSGFLVYN